MSEIHVRGLRALQGEVLIQGSKNAVLPIDVYKRQVLMGRLFFLMIYKADYYSAKAEQLHERERTIKAARGRILDANGTVIATNRTVCTICLLYTSRCV